MPTTLLPNLAFLFIPFAFALGQGQNELTVVPHVDLQRYVGMWYEIARLPNSFQTKCQSDVTATYILNSDGTLDVINNCLKSDGTRSEARGKAKRASDDQPLSKLKVRFAPAFLSWLPFVWGDYWILALDKDYSYVVIGEPSRQYLWILSRTPALTDSTIQSLLSQIRSMGYDLSSLLWTKQSMSPAK
jgi:apolipoprotein D and lipocalin family protein